MVFVPDTRETGFVNGITAAGVTYAVTRACTMGDLVECSCDKNTRHLKKIKHGTKKRKIEVLDNNLSVSEGDWEWGGCGDNVNFGLRKSRDFLDTRYKKRSDMKTLVKLHNYDAGRLVSFWV